MRLISIVLLALVAAAGCAHSGSYHYQFNTHSWDDYTMGTLNIDSPVPNARVYAKLRYKGAADMNTPHGEASHDMSGQIDHPMKDWTLLGTTPITDFQVLLAGKASDHHLTSSATFTMQLDDLSLRIEKEGFNTMELNHVGFVGGKSKLTLELVPAAAVPTTRPAQAAQR